MYVTNSVAVGIGLRSGFKRQNLPYSLKKGRKNFRALWRTGGFSFIKAKEFFLLYRYPFRNFVQNLGRDQNSDPGLTKMPGSRVNGSATLGFTKNPIHLCRGRHRSTAAAFLKDRLLRRLVQVEKGFRLGGVEKVVRHAGLAGHPLPFLQGSVLFIRIRNFRPGRIQIRSRHPSERFMQLFLANCGQIPH